MLEDLRRLETRLVEVAKTLGLNERQAIGSLVDRLRRRRRPRIGWRGVLTRLSNLQRNLRMIGRSPEVDEFGHDPVYTEVVFPLIDFFYEHYFRVELLGTEHLPKQGPAMLVCNHAGAVPFDAILVAHAVRYKVFPPRRCRALAEDHFVTAPYLAPFLTRIGLVRADRRNAARLLRAGQFVATFPEGAKGLGKYYQHRYRLQRFGRGGYIRVALATGAQVIPVAIVGHEETYPIVAKLDYLGRLMGLPFAPLTINFLFGGPFGLLPLPAHWSIRFGEPMDVSAYSPADAENDLLVNTLSQAVRTRLQAQVDRAVASRGSVWLG